MALINRRHLVKLEREVDVFMAREQAASMATGKGFDRYQASDIETSVSELATNVLKYGKRGWVSLRVDQIGFEAVVTDEGPGFDESPKSRSGLGVGLSGVERLMDIIEVKSAAGGSEVTVRKHLRGSPPDLDSTYWVVDIVGRTKSDTSVSGDSSWVRGDGESLEIAVIDGLGSGQGAALASASVIDALEASDVDRPLDELIGSAHERARSSRGAVCLLARVDLRSQEMEYTGVGDVRGFVAPSGERLSLAPGILGVDDPDVQMFRLPWTEDTRLIAWTDGIEVPSEELAPAETKQSAGDWAEEMALHHGDDRDDGLILLARRRMST